MATIVYHSNTGSAKEYAEMLSEKISAPAVALEKADGISPDEEIIFIGWLMAGTIQGLAQAREKFTNIKCVAFTGLIFKEKNREEIVEKNAISEPIFFLPGNFHMDKLKGMYKMMMSMMLKMIKGKLKETDNPNSDKMIAAIENGIEQVSEDKLGEILEFLQ